jgi:hypothetical protein
MLDAVIRLQFNTVETIWRQQKRGRPSTSVWKKILMKTCQSTLEGKIYRAVISCVRERERGAGSRTAERPTLLNIKTLMTTM